MSETYKMRCGGDCGPAAVSFCTQIDQDVVEQAFYWQHHHELGGLREDLQDHPWAHFDAVVKLGFSWKLRKCRDLLDGTATPNKTIVLLHPDARHKLLAQHWVVYAGRDYDGVVLCHWGDGKPPRRIPEFEEWYSWGTPACAYEIVKKGEGQTKLTWFQRFYIWIMRKFA